MIHESKPDHNVFAVITVNNQIIAWFAHHDYTIKAIICKHLRHGLVLHSRYRSGQGVHAENYQILLRCKQRAIAAYIISKAIYI